MLKAVVSRGGIRPLEPLPVDWQEGQPLRVEKAEDGETSVEEDWLDSSFLRYLEPQADESVTLEQVRAALAKIPGSISDDFRRERDDRF